MAIRRALGSGAHNNAAKIFKVPITATPAIVLYSILKYVFKF